MATSEACKKFINDLSTSSKFSLVSEMIKTDIEKFRNDITNMVLRKKIQLEGRWTDYILSDVNVLYEEDMLKLNDLFQMYGIRNDLPPLKASDIALVVTYQYTLDDAFGNLMDTVNLFHVTIKGSIGDDDYINKWFILYDTE